MKEFIVQISAGTGPAECCWVVSKTLKEFMKEARDQSIEIDEIGRLKGDQNGTLKSVSLFIKGICVDQFLEEWVGSIQWIGKSPFRRFHKRKNWFIGIETFDSKSEADFDPSSIKFETFRSSGPGGQFVNKVETAVRAIHIPTKLSVTASETASQSMNKKIAIGKLKTKLDEYKMQNLVLLNSNKWIANKQVKRGNPTRVYEGDKFKLKQK